MSAEAAKIPVVVDLWAPWCGPCRMVSPALEQLARDLAGKVKLVKVNVDTSPQISQRFGAQAIPTLLVLRRGQVIARQTGAVPLAALRTWADNALAATERWSAILTIVVQTPTDADRLKKNPLGAYVHSLNWSKELG